jgi:hypothetical protein
MAADIARDAAHGANEIINQVEHRENQTRLALALKAKLAVVNA